MMSYEKIITVHCPQCDTEFDEAMVKFVNIEEDEFGQDRLTFVCPKCGETVSSLRRG